jgi:ATPase family associated with various cellular activities (AAA)
MSIAGIRSNRGDGYQTLVAFDWALTVLTDPQYLWLEIDSLMHSIDDVVIGKVDGALIACQCKKNQTDFKAWAINDLSDELKKAASLLRKNHNAEVRFYSRSNFGDLAKLREHCSIQNDQASYISSLGIEHQSTDAALAAYFPTSAPNFSTYEFLRRTMFVASDELARMADFIRERLSYIATNPTAAFDTLWTRLDQLGARMGQDNVSTIQHRLTKDDLKAILHKAGVMLVPPANLAEVRLSFTKTSAIGRSWRTEIAGHHISSPVVNELLVAIDAKKRAILLTGLPGSGKTCVMLALQEMLETRAQTQSDIVPLFIQSHEFADLVTAQDRQAQGLAADWVEKAARLAENATVIVIIDSLDVLSIARDHRVLTYFLAQVDRLLLIPNISVVTACRDFDRHYDRRIAARKWDCELTCQPLDWNAEIEPLLNKLDIAAASIDEVTRELITNPRELALFVELAQRGGSFNVVTSQALAQRYLDTVVRGNNALGDEAIKAIETIASDMLHSRSLVVPHQRFSASQEILRALCSLNVLQESKDGKLMFGHQTLLDVLVISGALRIGVTLNEFLKSLPPVPFVRPSIRSFVAQLALGERRQLRKQLGKALKGDAAFHLRRLVAELFAEQKPLDEDWPLIRDLRDTHPEVFQVIYGANAIEWHYFWLKHLVPVLKNTQDAEGMTRHVYRIAHWVNKDNAGVLAVWMDALSLDWFDKSRIAEQLAYTLAETKSENLSLVVPLIERLLSQPRSAHSSLGKVIARCVTAGVADDSLLWRYISDDISDEDLIEFSFNIKLHIHAHEFGDREENFIRHRMEQSTALLNLALDSIERWSAIRASIYGETRVGYRYGFLDKTSYENVHSQRDIRHVDSIDVLLGAVEAAILCHARTNSIWWRSNRDRLCSSHEGALIYFGTLACTAAPEANIDLIGRMLCDKNLLEFSLSYELGTLIQSAFVMLDRTTQDSVMATVLDMYKDEVADENSRSWKVKRQAELIVTIPSCLRLSSAQAVMDEYEKKAGPFIRLPDIRSRGGMVSAPFSYEVFLSSGDSGVLRLLSHYLKFERDFDDHLVGGAREVGQQLREASSRHPIRFLSLLPNYWIDIPDWFRDDIMDGAATYLAHRHGNLQTNDQWVPVEESDAFVLMELVLDELERHPYHWQHRRSAAKALEACSNVICDDQNAKRLIFLAIGFVGLREDNPIKGDKVDLISLGINMAKGDVAEALMILAKNLKQRGTEFPELLAPTLHRFANDAHPAVRSLILRHLPYFQSIDFDLGWSLFHSAMQDANGLWKIAEPCLYYAHHDNFEVVRPLLARLHTEGNGTDLETWGRISALAALTGRIDNAVLLRTINALDKAEAWRGAATVWAHVKNIQLHREQCLDGLNAGLNAGTMHSEAVAVQIARFLDDRSLVIPIPVELIRRCFDVFKTESDNDKRHDRLYGIHEWLNATSLNDPELALATTEIYLEYVNLCKQHLYDHKNSLTQLMTRLFAEAEEREQSDNGAMLLRVVVVQDALLSLGVNGVADWLKAAERP